MRTMSGKLWSVSWMMMYFVACAGQTNQSTNLPVADFEKAISIPGIQLLDVRTPGEYQSGHLKNSFLANWNNEAEFKERIQSLEKDKPIYTYCASGARSNAATQWLRANGYTAYNLDGGIAAWKRADKPVEGMKSVKQISKSEFFAMIPADKTVLVDIGASWCPPCKKMDPVIDSLAREQGNNFQLIKIDGGDQTTLCKELGVEAFPVFIIYKQQKEVWRKQGIVPATSIVAAIQ